MATEQITITAQDLRACGRAVERLNPTTDVTVSHAEDLITLVWHPNGTTGVAVRDGKVLTVEEG